MRRRMWFGTRGYETWVPTPAINPTYERSGFTARADYVGGGAGIRSSKNAHNIYVLSWPPTKTRDEARLITDFADGIYDREDGVNLIYWIDPMARDKNVLSQAWATPSLATEDAPSLITDAYGFGRPESVPMPANAFRYPARAARYKQTPESITKEQYIPIPPGFSAWVGIHGAPDAAGRFYAQPVNGFATVAAPVDLPVTGTTSALVDTEFSSAASSGIVLGIHPTVSTVQFTLYGLIVQILPQGQAPIPGNWISGQGHSGCQFQGSPSKTPYSAKLDRVALTARLEETGMDL